MRSGEEDLATPARIREAALQLFPKLGYDTASLRTIARSAGVSPALIVHHFGSKAGLLEACDRNVLQLFDDWKTKAIDEGRMDDQALFTAALERAPDVMRYLAWAFTEPRASVDRLFDSMLDETIRHLELGEAAGMIRPGGDRRSRAAVMLVMRLGGFLLSDHLSRALGIDIYSPDGMLEFSGAGLDILATGVLTEDTAARARAGLERAKATRRKETA